MHTGAKQKPNFTYTLIWSEQAVTIQERGLGVMVYSSVKAYTQRTAAAKKANSITGIIRKGMENKLDSIRVSLHKSAEQNLE